MTGSGKSMNFPFVKQIRLNQKQMDKFDANEVRNFLDGGKGYKDIDNQYIVYVIREMFESGVLKVYSDKLTEQYKMVLESI